MKKEVFIAIIIGFIIGLLITFGIVTAQQSLKKSSLNQNPSQSTQVSPSPQNNPNPQNIIISSPENGQLVDQDVVIITGTTTPQSLIAIMGTKDYTTTPSDEQGNFSAEIRLQEGANQITIKAYDQSGIESQEEITIIYIPDSAPIEQPTPTNQKLKSGIKPTPTDL